MLTVAPKCWICRINDAETGEHKVKRSERRAEYGKPSQAEPLFYHDAKRHNWRMGGLDNPLMKFGTPICADCNNARTQPHDLAFERLSAVLRNHKPDLRPGDIVCPRSIFPLGAAREMRNVHLYCVKILGCTIMDAPTVGPPIPIDIGPFSAAIMKGRAHPAVYLQFGCDAWFADEPRMGGSNPRGTNFDGKCVRLDWHHFFGAGLGVRITYLAQGLCDRSMTDAWHPRRGIAKLVMADLRQAASTP